MCVSYELLKHGFFCIALFGIYILKAPKLTGIIEPRYLNFVQKSAL